MSPLVRLAEHTSPVVRFGVVMGLAGQEIPEAIEALIRLSADPDVDVRNWSTYELGAQMEADTPEIREALHLRLSDENSEVRGEALVGLAQRRDPRVVAALLQEWEHDEIGKLSIEAAEIMVDPCLLPHLEEFLATLDWSDDDVYFRKQLLSAITACGGEVAPDPAAG